MQLIAILKSQSETGSNCRHYNLGVFKHNKISDEPALSQYLGKSQKNLLNVVKFQNWLRNVVIYEKNSLAKFANFVYYVLLYLVCRKTEGSHWLDKPI